MQIRDVPLSDDVLDHYESEGIEELYPPQAAAVEAGVAAGENVVTAIPTAAGKTLIAELAMLTADGPALYIVPLRALAREKYESFSGLPGVDVGISTGDYDSAAEDLAGYDVVVATSEKVDSAIRNGASWVADLACVVVDEVHLLGAEGRGPTLEVTLANLRRRVSGVQVVALSATIDNPGDVADWLDAVLVETTWRPVDLRTGVYAGGAVAFDDGTDLDVGVRPEEVPPSADADTEATSALVADAVERGGQALAFVRSRREAESLAERLATDGFDGAADAAADVEDLDGTTAGRRLADCLRDGVAFHHAGLRSDHRAVVETAFRDRELAVICATPTLAAGVNVPARRVVVRDQRRYTGSGTEYLPVLEVHQMCGRAGRPHLDPYGEAVLVADENGREELWERYVEADPEPVESKLRDRTALRTHVLSIVASGFADTRAGVLDAFGATFYAHQTPEGDLSGVVDSVVGELADREMIVDGERDSASPPASDANADSTAGPESDPDAGSDSNPGSSPESNPGRAFDGRLVATELGAQVSRQYVTPETGSRIVAGLRTIRGMAESDVTGLTVLQLICDTPDMQDTYLGNRERADMYQFASRHAAEFTVGMNDADEFERWLESVKTARILHEWTEGADVEALVERYRIGPGDLESRLERAEWLLGAADALADVIGVDAPQIAEVRSRL